MALRPGYRIPLQARFSAPVQTGRGAHPVPCTMGTGPFRGSSGQGGAIIPHPHLVRRLKKEYSYTFPPLWIFNACFRVNFIFIFYIYRPKNLLEYCTMLRHITIFKVLKTNIKNGDGVHVWNKCDSLYSDSCTIQMYLSECNGDQCFRLILILFVFTLYIPPQKTMSWFLRRISSYIVLPLHTCVAHWLLRANLKISSYRSFPFKRQNTKANCHYV